MSKDFSAEVKVSLQEMIDHNEEGFLNLLSELATGDQLLMDIKYKLIGIGNEPNTIVIRVTGDSSECWREQENEKN